MISTVSHRGIASLGYMDACGLCISVSGNDQCCISGFLLFCVVLLELIHWNQDVYFSTKGDY